MPLLAHSHDRCTVFEVDGLRLICVVCIGLTACGLISSSTRVNAIAATIAFFVVGFFFSVFLSPAIARFNLWSLLQTSLSLSTSGAAFYFMTDTEEQYKEGPHFTPLYYNSVIGTVGAVMSLVGVATFQRYFSTYRYRNLLLVTNIAFCLMNALDTVLFKRLNVSMGIPDHAFVLGTSCMQNVLMQWQWMPQVIILSYFCPRGMEATMYALLAGCHNLGNTIASCWGALLLEMLDVNPTGGVGESAQFENLWKASLLASLMPIITVVALFQFIPDVKQGDPVVDPNAEATQGSLWRQYWAVVPAPLVLQSCGPSLYELRLLQEPPDVLQSKALGARQQARHAATMPNPAQEATGNELNHHFRN
ncbi:unnamed protein product [Symbiodinium necroappetens]|uniref:Uncharacterized protein n=1 Tax=Symbiodinium necroappetens TaxID=1628268 RepID=A0A812NNB5_9DINO|nr:unnamed protein product [Symbiodinium necroappetens]